MSDVILYTKPSCVQCSAVARRLSASGVPFTPRDLTAPENAADLERFKALGFLSAPVTEFGDIAFPGYNPAEVDRVIAAWQEQAA